MCTWKCSKGEPAAEPSLIEMLNAVALTVEHSSLWASRTCT